MKYEDMIRIRQRDRLDLFVAALVAALIHYGVIVFVRIPRSEPRALVAPLAQGLVLLRPYVPPASGRAAEGGERSDSAAMQPALAAAAADKDAASPSSSPVRIGAEGVPPRMVEAAAPQPKRELRGSRVAGVISLDVVVLKDGAVGDVTVLRGLDADSNALAVDAVRRSRFQPGTIGGQPVDALLTIDFRIGTR